jgi:hypothetical protein
VTLNLTEATGVRERRLRSQANAPVVSAPQLTTPAGDDEYNYASFVYLRTDDGTITIDGVKLYSWDPLLQTFDADIANGRSYLLAKYAAHLNISHAELSYLGSADGESYGVSWRDTYSNSGFICMVSADLRSPFPHLKRETMCLLRSTPHFVETLRS